MSTATKIEWATHSWSPVVGCSKVSDGCKNCYAIPFARRLGSNPNPKVSEPYCGLTHDVDGPLNWTGVVRCLPERLSEPLRWKKPRRVFVNPMSDLFHEGVPIEFIAAVMRAIEACPQHTFMVLTKRPERMRMAMTWWCGDEGQPLPNVWLGVSVENQQAADERIPFLLQTPAAVRFLSCEPLLGPVSLRWPLWEPWKADVNDEYDGLRRLDWLICGGESGPKARPMHPDWARSLRDQCAAAGVPFFFKQHGEWAPRSAGWGAHNIKRAGELVEMTIAASTNRRSVGTTELHAVPMRPEEFGELTKMERVGKHAAGRLLDGKEHNAFPEPPHAP